MMNFQTNPSFGISPTTPGSDLTQRLASIGPDLVGGPNLAMQGAAPAVAPAVPAVQTVAQVPGIQPIVVPVLPGGPAIREIGGLQGAGTGPNYMPLDSLISKPVPEAMDISSVNALLRASRPSTSGPDLKIGVEANSVGEGILKGAANGIQNWVALNNYAQQRRAELADREYLRKYIVSQQKATQDAADAKYQREIDVYRWNYDSALNDEAYGETPEERQRNAILDAANGWSYLKRIQEGRAGAYAEDEKERNKEARTMETFKARRSQFKTDYGFDPFNDEDMEGRKFSAAEINAFRQLFPGKEFADEVTTMERNLKQQQAEANLEGTRARTARTRELTTRPPSGGGKPPAPTIARQLKEAYEGGLITEEEYKQRLLGGGGKKPGPVVVPQGGGFDFNKPKPGGKPKGSRVDSFSSKYGF